MSARARQNCYSCDRTWPKLRRFNVKLLQTAADKREIKTAQKTDKKFQAKKYGRSSFLFKEK
jgi:hypothetical protein